MKKLINNPNRVVEEMIEGYAKAHPHHVRVLEENGRSIVTAKETTEGKVGVLIGVDPDTNQLLWAMSVPGWQTVLRLEIFSLHHRRIRFLKRQRRLIKERASSTYMEITQETS